jgi:hypothetical protein
MMSHNMTGGNGADVRKPRQTEHSGK